MASTLKRLQNQPGGKLGVKASVSAGDRVYVPVDYDGAPTTVEVKPGTGATVRVYVSLADADEMLAAGALGVLWNRGAVTAGALDSFAGRLGTVVIESTGGPADYEVGQ